MYLNKKDLLVSPPNFQFCTMNVLAESPNSNFELILSHEKSFDTSFEDNHHEQNHHDCEHGRTSSGRRSWRQLLPTLMLLLLVLGGGLFTWKHGLSSWDFDNLMERRDDTGGPVSIKDRQFKVHI